MADPSDLVREHADKIAGLHKSAEERIGPHQRSIESISARLGRPLTLYLALALLFLWLLGNKLAPQAWDGPPYPLLQLIFAASAFFLTTVVLIAQNRQLQGTHRNAQLQLHLNMLQDQKISKLIALVEELRRDLPSVRDREDQEASAMEQPADAGEVLTALEKSLEE